jgi:hypothetical protein
MVDPRRAVRDESPSPEAPREWVVANGLGGYASATITGEITRRYHGFLIAAQPAPLGRMVVLNDLEVDIELAEGQRREHAREGPIPRFHVEHGPAELAIQLAAEKLGVRRHQCADVRHCAFRTMDLSEQ